MATLDDLLYQVNAFNTGFKKTASSRTSDEGLANFFSSMGKVAEETENEDEEEKENEDEEEKKEGSCRRSFSKKASKRTTRRSPQNMVNYFRKVAILDNPDTQGTTISTVGPHDGDGVATEKARETDNYISFDEVEEQAESNPQRADDSETKDLIEDEAPNSEALVKEIKEGSLHLYTRDESEALQKFASLGYRAYIDDMSTKLANEIISQKMVEKQAAYNIDALAAQRLAENDMYNKLAYLKQTDPNAFYQIKTAVYNGLI